MFLCFFSRFGEFGFTYHQKQLLIQFKTRHNDWVMFQRIEFLEIKRMPWVTFSCEHIKKNVFKNSWKTKFMCLKKVQLIMVGNPLQHGGLKN